MERKNQAVKDAVYAKKLSENKRLLSIVLSLDLVTGKALKEQEPLIDESGIRKNQTGPIHVGTLGEGGCDIYCYDQRICRTSC